MKFFPDRKVLAGGISAVLAWLVMLGLNQFFHVTMPADVQTQLAGLIGFVMAYVVPPSAQDIVRRLNDDLVKMAQDDPSVPVTKP